MNPTMTAMIAEDLHTDELLNGQVDSEPEVICAESPLVEPVRPTVTPPSARAQEPPSQVQDQHSAVVLDRLISLADNYHSSGERRQAVEMYLRLVHAHPQTPQSRTAEMRLIEIADRYHELGELHSARWIYEQLL